MLTNNNQKLFPLLIPSYLIPHIKTLKEPQNPEKGLVPLDFDTRPYRVLITTDDEIISEWMWDSVKGTILFTPFKKVKEQYLHKGMVKEFFVQGTHGRYELLKNGQFIFPTLDTPISVIVNNEKQLFGDVFPNVKYFIQATARALPPVKQPDGSMIAKSSSVVNFVGLGWRREVWIKSLGLTIDLSVTMIVHSKEKGIHFKTIASHTENEKLIYPTSLKINKDKNIEIEVRRGNNEL